MVVPTPLHHVKFGRMISVIPFIFLLAAIAIFPLWRVTGHWWESNWNRLYLALACAGVTLVFTGLQHGWDSLPLLLQHALLDEYFPFIVLLFSLFTISGGIRIDGDLPATPWTNGLFLIGGGVLASIVGTTGAAMLLIRPLLDTNSERKHVQHTVVFFIFIVCNCGGCLLPIGDPPLFLGYLEGIPFLWTFWKLWPAWLVVNGTLVALYYLLDHIVWYPRETLADIRRDTTLIRPLRMRGIWPNLYLLLGVVVTVALVDPRQELPGTDWRPPHHLREAIQLFLVAISWWGGDRQLRAENRFSFHAIAEVAALFIGIFVCVQPALEILGEYGPRLGIDTPQKFFWATGALSSALDNAPTYMVFYRAAESQFGGTPLHSLVQQSSAEGTLANQLLAGVSLGAVFLGAMTYIGNGPNFMVRAIAEESGVRMPGFFGYISWYSVPLLGPVLWGGSLIFL